MSPRRWPLGLALAAWLGPLAQAAWAQEAPDMKALLAFVRWEGLLACLPLVLGAWALLHLLQGLSERLAQRFAHRRPLIQQGTTVLRFAVYLGTLATGVFLGFRLDSTALAVLGGGLAFAVGFALRDVVAAFIAGLLIIFDRPFQVGDRVSYAGEYGDIVKIGLRSVRMNTLDHNLVTIPNNKVLTDVTSSGNYGALEMQVAMSFHIGLDQDPRRAMALVEEACLVSPYVHLEQAVPVLLAQVCLAGGLLAFEIKARPYVYDHKQEKAFVTDVTLRVWEAFRAHGIQPPALLHRGVAPPSPEADLAPSAPEGEAPHPPEAKAKAPRKRAKPET